MRGEHAVAVAIAPSDKGSSPRARGTLFFKGACTRGIYDNMRTAVETVLIGKDRQFNRRFLRMCGHFLVEPTACTPAA